MYEIKITKTFATEYASLYKDGKLVGHFISGRDALNKIDEEYFLNNNKNKNLKL